MTIEPYKSSIVIALLAALLYHSNLSPASAKPDTAQSASGYELVQYDIETDKTIVQLSRFGVKVINLKGGTVVISTPPKWEVAAFSTKAKRICRTDMRHFSGEYRLFYTIFQKPGFSDIPLEKKSTVSNLKGWPIECFKSGPAFEQKQVKSYHSGELKGNFPACVEYSTCRKLASTPQMEFVLRRFYGMPDAPGVPIGLVSRRVDTTHDSELETLKISAKHFTAEDFQIPTGLQPVESIAALRADQNSVERAAQFVDSVSKLKMH